MANAKFSSSKHEHDLFEICGSKTIDAQSHKYVLFEPDDGERYYVAFETGEIFLDERETLLIQGSVSLILSNGNLFIYDINKKELLFWDDRGCFSEAINADYNRYFIVCDFTKIFIYDTKLMWKSTRVAADEIKLDEVKDHIVYGSVWDMLEWIPFTLDLVTFDYKCAWECKM